MRASSPAHASGSATGRHQRRVRNYLLDPRFQLKYAGLLVAVTLVASAVLGYQLMLTSRAVIAESERAVAQGRETVRRGQAFVAESQKVSAVVAMNITKAPDYQDNPELASLFQEDAAARDKKLADEQGRLELDSQHLQKQTEYLAAQQSRTLRLLLIGFSALVVLIGLAGIVVTHRVAGPVFKMMGLMRQIGDGKLEIHTGLRRGDELVAFFDEVMHMLDRLRARHVDRTARLGKAIERLEGKVDDAQIEPLRIIHREMVSQLEQK